MISLFLFTSFLACCFGNVLPNEGDAQVVFPSGEADPVDRYPVESVWSIMKKEL